MFTKVPSIAALHVEPRIVEFSVPGNRPPEIGVIPKHLPFGDYRGENGSSDIADEQELVRYDFYKLGNTAADGAVAVLPKDKSTSAAVELFAIPDDSPKSGPETPAYCAAIRKSSKDLAKFKQTDNAFTTTSTAAILRYYHVSRVVGNICDIEPAVLRTMDIEQHKRVVKMQRTSGSTELSEKVGICSIGTTLIRRIHRWHEPSSPTISCKSTVHSKRMLMEKSITPTG